MSSYTLIYAISDIVWFVAAGAVAKRGDWKEEIGFGMDFVVDSISVEPLDGGFKIVKLSGQWGNRR